MTVDPSTGAITLRAQFPNPRRDLLSGTYVRVRVEQGVDENALTVPQRGLIRSGQGASVLVVGADGNVAAVPALLASAQAFVLASDHEGFPLSILEAMRAGLPVVATDLPGIREQLDDGRCGLLCAPGSVPRANSSGVRTSHRNSVRVVSRAQPCTVAASTVATPWRSARRAAAARIGSSPAVAVLSG
ncbi:glycosyltransferase, partial [Staphylococcus aureus]|nr:glycosyltransferase [Staphylococcus aureus]